MEISFPNVENGHFLPQHERSNFYDRMKKVVVAVGCVLPLERGETTPLISNGGGFVVDKRGYIITAAHVIHDVRTNIFVRRVIDPLPGLDVTLVSIERDKDVALLKLTDQQSDWDYVDFSDEIMEVGMGTFSIGSPSIFDFSFLLGQLVHPCRFIKDLNFSGDELSDLDGEMSVVQINNCHGFKKILGSPVFNSSGRVIGMHSFVLANYDFAIPACFLREWYENRLKRKTTVRYDEEEEETVDKHNESDHSRRHKGKEKSKSETKNRRNRHRYGQEHKCRSMDAHMDGLRAYASVVSVASFSGNRLFFACSGSIIKCEYDADGSYVSTILTTANLLMCSTCYIHSLVHSSTIPEDIKVEVRSGDGTVFEGHVSAWDFHYNIALVKIKSHAMQPCLKFRNLEDAVGVDTFGSNFMYPHSDLFHIKFGDMVVVLGRHYMAPYELDITPGTFSIDRDLDCRELFRANCKIAKCCVGGPLLNQQGELIGVAFQHSLWTPFLPINIVCRCLEHFKKYGKFCRPYVGMYMYNLYAATVSKLEKFLQKFPDTFKGVWVESVIEESPADFAGILECDVIIGCNGSSVDSYLEFMGMIFDKVGESIELLVLRTSSGARLNLNMVVEETSPCNFYSWPLLRPARSYRGMGSRLLLCCGTASRYRDTPA